MDFLTQLRVIMAFHRTVETQLGQVEYNHSAPQTTDLCGAESGTILLAYAKSLFPLKHKLQYINSEYFTKISIIPL